MKLDHFKAKITGKAAVQLLTLRKNSPNAMFAAGVVGVVATMVLSSRATLKMDEVLREGEANKLVVAEEQEIANREGKNYDGQKAGLSVRVNTSLKIARIYGPSVIVGVLSIGALTGAHVTLSKRNVGLTAAYAALNEGFREYRKRVVEELGTEKDQEFRYGVEYVEQAVDTDDGPAVVTVKRPIMKESIYTRIFDKSTSRHWSPDYGQNQLFLKVQEQYANDLLNAKGYVFLNQILASLGLEESSMGQVVGWVAPRLGGKGDGVIDFGIFRDIEAGQNFAQGNERSALLDFNVDGDILGMLDGIKEEKKRLASGVMGS